MRIDSQDCTDGTTCEDCQEDQAILTGIESMIYDKNERERRELGFSSGKERISDVGLTSRYMIP
jgi:hypothetical protein